MDWGDAIPMAPSEMKRSFESPWQVTPQGEVFVGHPGELHMEMEDRLGLGESYTPAAEGVVIRTPKGIKIDPYANSHPDYPTAEHEHEIKRQYEMMNKTANEDYQPLNDASPFDFTRPPLDPGSNLDNERPWIVHAPDHGPPEVLVGGLGDLHNNIRDQHDIGLELLRGYHHEPTDEHTVEMGDEQYLPLVEKHFENMLEDPYPTVHEAAGIQDKKWAYLNGEVGFGDFHHQILHTLAERQNLPKQQADLVSNLALANAHPANTGHDVAWGAFHQGYPVFWRTNVDRNAIWDSVQNARNVVEPPNPVTAGLKEFSEIDIIKESMIGSGGTLNEVQPGGMHMNYDGQPVNLPEQTTSTTPQLTRTQTYYAANVEKAGQIIGSVSVEVEGNTRRNGEHWQEVVIHDAWVDPSYRGSDVWLKLYRWVRQHWPHDRIFGEFANEAMGDFFEQDNKRNYLGDDEGWEDTAIGQGTDGGIQTGKDYGPSTYGKVAAAAEYDSIFPVPERMLPQFGLDPVPGGRYMIPNGPPNEWQEATDQVRPGGMLQVTPEGKPVFHVQKGEAEPLGRGHGILTRVNMFKQKAGWRWGQHDMGIPTLISVEHGPNHYYTLQTHFNSPVHLKTYPGKSEPRLRPTSRGDLDFGEQVSTIRLRGREHPVYDRITVEPRRATEHVGAMTPEQRAQQFQQRAPWYVDLQGNPVIGGWGQFHDDIGGRSAYEVKGDVNRAGEVTIYHQNGHPHPYPDRVMEHITPAMRSAFGFGFHPVHTEAPSYPHNDAIDFGAPPEAPPVPPEAAPATVEGLRARLKGLAFTLRPKTAEGLTEPQGEYHLVGAQPGEARKDIQNRTGLPEKLSDGQWASWSGWPDAYRFIFNGKDYMEQPESALESGHGHGHPGLKEQWRKLLPGRKVPNPAYSGHIAGWHVPMRDGSRGIIPYMSSHPNFGAVGDLQAMIERAHNAPSQMIMGAEHLNPDLVQIQHPHGNIVMPPSPFDWDHYGLTGEMRRKEIPWAQPEVAEPGTLDFSSPAPAPGALRT